MPPLLVNWDLEEIHSLVDVGKLESMLKQSNYHPGEIAFLVNGFKEGFSIQYQGPVDRRSSSPNITFSVGNSQILWDKLIKEIQLKWVAGRFETIPFNHYIQSPVGLIPKDEGTKTRLIFHLSYNFGKQEKSLNFHTPKEVCMVKYKDLDQVVCICLEMAECSLTKTVLLAKSVLRSAFRLIPLS